MILTRFAVLSFISSEQISFGAFDNVQHPHYQHGLVMRLQNLQLWLANG